jgi:hypothetical protein
MENGKEKERKREKEREREREKKREASMTDRTMLYLVIGLFSSGPDKTAFI